MSRFGDSSSEGSIKSIRIEEDFGDDVSILDGDPEPNWRIMMFKVCISLLFVGACTAAIIYSINKSEEKRHDESINNTKPYLPYDLNQVGNGLMLIFRRDTDDESKPTFQAPIWWIQEADKKRLLYRVGNETKPMYTLYLEENVGFNETVDGCSKVDHLTYDTFIDQMGLRFVPLRSSEQVKDGDVYEDVYVYEGEPSNEAQFYGEKPGLIRGFTTTRQDLLMGFEQFFLSKSNIFKVEHWIPHMKHNDGVYSVLDFIPASCTVH